MKIFIFNLIYYIIIILFKSVEMCALNSSPHDFLLAHQISKLINNSGSQSIGFYKININYEAKDTFDEIKKTLLNEITFEIDFLEMFVERLDRKLDIILYFIVKLNLVSYFYEFSLNIICFFCF